MKKLLEGIDLEGLDIPSTVEKGKRIVAKEAPALKKGFRSVESDVGNALKALYDFAAGDDDADENPDHLKKYLG